MFIHVNASLYWIIDYEVVFFNAKYITFWTLYTNADRRRATIGKYLTTAVMQFKRDLFGITYSTAYLDSIARISDRHY